MLVMYFPKIFNSGTNLNEKKDSFDCLQLMLDDGRKIEFSSTDAAQDSTSCHWHIHSVDYAIS